MNSYDTGNSGSHRLHPGTGAALILTTLICICLLCYAALTLVSAQADRRLTAQYEERTAEYYDAYRAGQAFLSEVDGQLRDLYEETYETSDAASPEAMYYSAASALTSAVDPEDADGEWYDEIRSVLPDAADGSAPLLLFTQEISDTQVYFLLLRVQYPADISCTDVSEDTEDSAYYRIVSSKTVTTVTYDYDTTLDVITK